MESFALVIQDASYVFVLDIAENCYKVPHLDKLRWHGWDRKTLNERKPILKLVLRGEANVQCSHTGFTHDHIANVWTLGCQPIFLKCQHSTRTTALVF